MSEGTFAWRPAVLFASVLLVYSNRLGSCAWSLYELHVHTPISRTLSLISVAEAVSLFCCTCCLCPVARASLFDSGFRCSLHTYHWRVLRSLARAAPLLILLPAVIFLACCPHCHLPRDLFWHCSQWSHWHIAHWPSRNLFVCYGLSCIWCLPI